MIIIHLIILGSSIKYNYLVNFSAQARKIKKIPPRKKFLIFQEMESSNTNTKKVLIFQETGTPKKNLIFS